MPSGSCSTSDALNGVLVMSRSQVHASVSTPQTHTLRLPASAEQVLARSQSGRAVIQDFVPLAESLEWQLGQQYLRDRGNKAFIGDLSPVPYVINNDGTLSAQAAE